MSQLNISQAARAAGVARSTIQAHIRQGKLSVMVMGNGEKTVDTSELIRVYGELATPGVVEHDYNFRHQTTPTTTPDNEQILHGKVVMLQEQVETLQRDKDEDRREKERLLGIIENQMRMLTYQPAAKERPEEPAPHPAVEEMKKEVAMMRKQNSYLIHMQRRTWWEKLMGKKYVVPTDG